MVIYALLLGYIFLGCNVTARVFLLNKRVGLVLIEPTKLQCEHSTVLWPVTA